VELSEASNRELWLSARRGIMLSILLLILVFASGCGTVLKMRAPVEKLFPPNIIGTQAVGSLRNNVEALNSLPETSLLPGTHLAELARQLDQAAIAQSAVVHEVQSAEAALKARQLDRYPQLLPSVSAPLLGSGSNDPAVDLFELASAGLSIKQVIWDGGYLSARLYDAELKVTEVSLQGWEERNDAVYDGLKAYVESVRYEDQLRELGRLKEELQAISALLEVRVAGGVADRGELLRSALALQDADRRILINTASQRRAQADLLHLLPRNSSVSTLVDDLGVVAGQCRRSWPNIEAPQDALGRVFLLRAQAFEKAVRAQRLPRVLLSGGLSYSRHGWSESAIGLRLDASNMLGLGRKGDLEAAAASTRAAQATYALERDDTVAELAQLEADYESMRADAAALHELIKKNDATLDLYEEQFGAASIALVEGIILHQHRTDTQIALIEVEVDMLLNCLRSSRRRGLLVPLGMINDD